MAAMPTKVYKKSVPGAGNGLFAAQDIAIGERLFNTLPPQAIAALNTPRLQDTCYHCCLPEAELPKTPSACTGCYVVRYCGKECQTLSWKAYHKFECKIFSALHPNILPNNARAILRLILRHGKKKTSEEEWKSFLYLESHLDDIKKAGGDKWDNLCLTAKAVKNYAGSELEEDFIRGLFCRLFVNSFNLTTATFDPIGIYIHPHAALMNHSCDYNADVGYNGPELYVKALKPLKKDEEIQISYIDATNPFERRQNELKEQYYFDCACTKCQKGPTLREDRFLSSATTKELSEVSSAETKALSLKNSINTIPSATGRITALEQALKTLNSTSAWPITRQPHPTIRHDLFLALISTGQYDKAFTQATIRHLRIYPFLYPDQHHAVRLVGTWVYIAATIELVANPDLEPQRRPLEQRYGLFFQTIIMHLLHDLLRLLRDDQNRFAVMVRRRAVEIRPDILGLSVDAAEMDREVGKLERLVADSLDAEGAVVG